MENQSRKQLEAFLGNYFAKQEGFKASDGMHYSFSSQTAKSLERNLKLRSALLSRINIIPTTVPKGQANGFDLADTLAASVDTDRNTRHARRGDWKPSQYQCQPTHFDAGIPYATVDAWVNHTQNQQDFEQRVSTVIDQRMLMDRVMVGFQGTQRAADSDRAANPRLQDVNIGWLQQIRLQAPAQYLQDVQCGEGQAYASLNALLRHAVNNKLPAHLRDDPLLVALIGADLLPNALAAPTSDPTQLQDLTFHQQRQGGMQAASAAFFPGKSILITRLDNLSLYFNPNSQRAHYLDAPEHDAVELYRSSADAYVIENLNACVLIDNITLAI